MIERKKKVCAECGELVYLYARKMCKSCDAKINPSKHSGIKSSNNTTIEISPLKSPKTPLKSKKKPTGELKLFLQLYAERGGRCEITGKVIPFDVNSFAHILSKGAYGRLRLEPRNIIMVVPEIHHLYDNSSKEKLLEKYPGALKIYELKDKLRYEYYNGAT